MLIYSRYTRNRGRLRVLLMVSDSCLLVSIVNSGVWCAMMKFARFQGTRPAHRNGKLVSLFAITSVTSERLLSIATVRGCAGDKSDLCHSATNADARICEGRWKKVGNVLELVARCTSPRY